MVAPPPSPLAGSAALLALADELREVRAICHCGMNPNLTLT